MTDPKETFERLQCELRQETKLQPKNRSKKYEELTLQHFLEHGRSTEDHDLWRECHMLEEMIAILNRRYLALNPHKRTELELKQISSESTFDIFSKYQEEVDEEGRSDEEVDDNMATMHPDLKRSELEILAAENYLNKTWGTQRKRRANTTSPEQRVDEPKAGKNPNPPVSGKMSPLSSVHPGA